MGIIGESVMTNNRAERQRMLREFIETHDWAPIWEETRLNWYDANAIAQGRLPKREQAEAIEKATDGLLPAESWFEDDAPEQDAKTGEGQ